MTKNYGIKVSRPGYDVNVAAPNELSFSSAYKTLKVHAHGSGTLTDASRTATIPHNLGYPPVFMVHTTMSAGFGNDLFSSGDYVLSPAGLSGVLTDPTVGVSDDLFAYADSTNLYIKAQENFGKLIYKPSPSDLSKCLAWEYSGSGGGTTTGAWYVGNVNVFDVEYGAIRFDGIDLDNSQSIYSANLNLYIEQRTGSGQVKMNVWGIDEDDTVDFDLNGVGTSRSKTTAVTASNSTLSSGGSLGVSVTSQVSEIISRVGWANSNAMGFIMWDNGTANGNDYGEDIATSSTLEILLSNTIASYKYTIFLNQLE